MDMQSEVKHLSQRYRVKASRLPMSAFKFKETQTDGCRRHRNEPWAHRYQRTWRFVECRFARWGKKMAVMSDKVLRDSLRRDGIRLASDLTNKQARNITEARKRGKFAYYKKGRLFFADDDAASQTTDTSDPRPTVAQRGSSNNSSSNNNNSSSNDRPRESSVATDRRASKGLAGDQNDEIFQ
nr:hypothetical protein BaRGS_025254 [Batillaria attramentaria]